MTTKHKTNFYFYTEASGKLVIYSFFSAGVYNMYYFYKNFLQRNDNSSQLVLIVKSVLYPFFCFGLINNASRNYKSNSWSKLIAVFLWVSLFIFVFAGGLTQGSIKYLAFATCIPLSGINLLFKKANSRM